jgi:hypothetical protein
LVGLVAASDGARAEPPSAESSGGADCLAKPNAQAAPGNHWYYHLDRASGRRCWYQRPVSGAQDDGAQSRPAPARAAVSPPADNPASESATDSAGDSREQSTEPGLAAPVQPYSWSTATPAPLPREQMTAPATVPAPVTAPATAPNATTVVEPASAEPPVPSRAPARVAGVERPAVPVAAEEGAHMPALLGAALALLIIVLGSIVARLAASFIRARRHERALDALEATLPPVYAAHDAPGLVPVMPRESDIRRTRRARAPKDVPAASRDEPDVSAGMSERVRGEETRALEENVRDLLRRLRNDLLDQPPSPAPAAGPQSPSAREELDQALANLRERRRKPG